MYLPMKLVLKDTVHDFMNFKDSVFDLTGDEFSRLYERTAHMQELQGETDLNEACAAAILRSLRGKRVLEVGCGRGYLARRLAEMNTVTACDIAVPAKLKNDGSGVRYVAANAETLPFADASFDYVVSTHTLEHVQDLSAAVRELRRVAREGLIVVVPKQRPYRYTFSLHTQFFPYEWSLRGALGPAENVSVTYLGDWLYYQRFVAGTNSMGGTEASGSIVRQA